MFTIKIMMLESGFCFFKSVEDGKVVVLMMDSFGVGGAKDAFEFGDEGANTFFHIQKGYKNLEIPILIVCSVYFFSIFKIYFTF